MKTTLCALFFLLAFTSLATADFVYDTDGDYMSNGGTYYIVPAIPGNGGGLGLAKTGNDTCPLSVVQDSSSSDGMPVRISSPYLIAYIYPGLPLAMSFLAVPTCAETPSRWIVVAENATDYVKIPGSYDDAVTGWFKIKQYKTLIYELEFCPLSSDSCGSVSISKGDNGERLLVVTNSTNSDPHLVVFKKASTSAA